MSTIETLECNLKYLRTMRQFAREDERHALEGEILEFENQVETLKAERDRLPPTRAHAKAMRKRHYFTGVPCDKGHISRRRTRNYECKRCHKLSEIERVRNERKATKEAQNGN